MPKETTPSPTPRPDAGARVEAGASAPEFRHGDYFPRDGTVDVQAWLSTHGVTSAFREAQCWDARDRVGVPPAPGLVCERHAARPPKTTSRIFRLEGNRLRMVWEGVVATWTNWLELTPILADTGAELVVHERRMGSCEAAFSEYNEKEQSGVPMDFGPVLREGCASRGIHSWSGDRYVKGRGPGVP